ncbi:MAG: hypothetical protein R6U43_08955 [Candidatus Krumholzibacteriales bacterium]
MKSKTGGSAFFSLNLLSDSKAVVFCLGLVFIFSCLSNVETTNSGREPDSGKIKWLDRIDALYPAQLYLTGLGMGSTREVAYDIIRGFQNKLSGAAEKR